MGVHTRTTSKPRGRKPSANTGSSSSMKKSGNMTQSDAASQPQIQSSTTNSNSSSLCKICNLIVSDDHNAVFCDSCDFWVHLERSGVTAKQFEFINSNAGRACKGLRWF